MNETKTDNNRIAKEEFVKIFLFLGVLLWKTIEKRMINMALISKKEMEIIVKIAQGFPNLSEFDKGYFLGVVESRAALKEQQNNKSEDFCCYSENSKQEV